MPTYNLLAYGGTGLGYGRSVGYSFVADANDTANVVAQDDDAILNDWTTGNYHGTPTPGISNGDTTSTVISSEIPWLTSGEMITSGVWYEMSYTDPSTGLTETVEAFLIWDDTNNFWGGFGDSYVFTTEPLIDGVSYTVTAVNNNAGVPWDVLICFVRGTRILTIHGEVAVEDLQVGDEVITRSNGPQEIRWIGSRTVPAKGHYAPIEFRSGAIGNSRDLSVSPNHRMLFSDSKLELYFGTSEVLAAAKHLVNDHNIRPKPGGDVEYFHLLFDNHEIIFAEGVPSESFHLGETSLGSFSRDTQDEILDLFPELATNISAIPAIHPSLKKHETKLLRSLI